MHKHKNVRILGLDPGITRTGFAVIERSGATLRALSFGCINTEGVRGYHARLLRLERELAAILAKYHPGIAAIEKLFYCKNISTAIGVGQARGIILLTLLKRGLRLEEFTPQQIKLTVAGYGKADKKQIQRMTQLHFHLAAPARPDDAADALATALTASVLMRRPTQP